MEAGRREKGEGKWEMGDGRREMRDRRWETGEWRREMRDRRREMGDRGRKIVNGRCEIGVGRRGWEKGDMVKGQQRGHRPPQPVKCWEL